MPRKNDSKNLEICVSSLVKTYLNLMLKKQYQEADILCKNFIDDYGSAFKQRAFNLDEDEYNKLLILLVLVKGFHDYLQLCLMTSYDNWHEDNSTVEEVWTRLCDCRERLKFSLRFYQCEAIDGVVRDLDNLGNFFRIFLEMAFTLVPESY